MRTHGTVIGVSGRVMGITALCLLICSVAAPCTLWADGSLTDLGTLGGNTSMPAAINSSGQIVGYSQVSGGSNHAFLYSKGVMTDLGTLGGTGSLAYGINDSGQIVGYSGTSGGQEHAFLYSKGVMTDLGTLGGTGSYAYAINNAGQVVGTSMNAGGFYHAFLYSKGVMTDLGTLGGTGSAANAINNQGQIVGTSRTSDGHNHAFLYSKGVMTDLGTLGGTESFGQDINESGQVVGSSLTSGGQNHAFLYAKGVMTDLGTLGGVESTGHGINKSGQITGSSLTSGGDYHAYLYSKGVMTDLGTLGGTASSGYGVSNSGLVALYSTTAGDVAGHAALYTPAGAASLKCTPASLSFGTVKVGKTSASRMVSLMNKGIAGGVLGIGAVSLSGANPADFTFDKSGCTSLPKGSSCTISVNVTPGSNGTRSAVMSIATYGTSAAATSVNLTANGVYPRISVPPALKFGTLSATTASLTKTVVIKNAAPVDLVVSAISLVGDPTFSQSNACGTIAKGKTCPVSVTFTPTGPGPQSAALNIASDDHTTPTATVAVTGTRK